MRCASSGAVCLVLRLPSPPYRGKVVRLPILPIDGRKMPDRPDCGNASKPSNSPPPIPLRDELLTHTANHRPPIPPNRMKTIREPAAVPPYPPKLVLLLFRVAPTATPEIQAPCTRHRCSASCACRFFENFIRAGRPSRVEPYNLFICNALACSNPNLVSSGTFCIEPKSMHKKAQTCIKMHKIRQPGSPRPRVPVSPRRAPRPTTRPPSATRPRHGAPRPASLRA